MGKIIAGIDLEEYFKTKDINDAVEKLSIEEELLREEDPGYKGRVFSAKDLNIMMTHLHNVIKNKDKKKAKKIDKSDDEEKEIEYSTSVPNAIKTILDCLKEVDNDLYMRVLGIVIGMKKDILSIYNVHDENVSPRIKSGELPDKSTNSFKDWRAESFIALMEDLDDEEYKRIESIISKDTCSFEDIFKILHEMSHNFDTDRRKEMINRDDIVSKKKKDKCPPMTSVYLSETTAILFEHILCDYIETQNPKLTPLISQHLRKRLLTNFESINETAIKSGILRKYEEDEFIDSKFLEDTVSFYNVKESAIDSFKKDPSMYESRKYAIAAFLVPTMIKEYKSDRQEGKRKLVRYLELCRENDFDGALREFGIDMGDFGCLNRMIDNFKEYLYEYMPQEENAKTGDER